MNRDTSKNHDTFKNPNEELSISTGPMTRSRVKRLKNNLSALVVNIFQNDHVIKDNKFVCIIEVVE